MNIRPEDIVEGNGKLTLGLIWTIILHFQVSMIKKPKVSSHNDATVIVERSVSSYYSSTNGASSSTSASRRVEHEVFLTLFFYPLLTRAKFAIFISPLHLIFLAIAGKFGSFIFSKILNFDTKFSLKIFFKNIYSLFSY